MKKIAFGSKPTGHAAHASPDAWVSDKPIPVEPTKRFTFDVPLSLHQRIKTTCAMDNLIMAEVVRELLEQRFPEKPDTRFPNAP